MLVCSDNSSEYSDAVFNCSDAVNGGRVPPEKEKKPGSPRQLQHRTDKPAPEMYK